MIAYYIFMILFGLFVLVVFVVGSIAVVGQRRQPLEKRLDRARQELLKRETATGSSELISGMYSKITDEMLRDMGRIEGFNFVDLTSRTISFQRAVVRDSSEGVSGFLDDAPMHVRGDLGNKRHRERLYRTLGEMTGDAANLTLRRDQLGALPKVEILNTAQEHGWTYQDEEIAGNEWRLIFRRDNQARSERAGTAQ